MTSPHRFLPFLAAALLLAPAASHAQAPLARPEIVGSRVRIHTSAASGVPLTGTLDAVRGDRLVVRLGDETESVVFPAASLSSLEVAQPRSGLRRNVLLGGSIGALAGAGLYLSWCYADHDSCQRAGGVAGAGRRIQPSSATVVSAAGGMLLGAAVGWLLTPERWQAVQLPLGFGVAPSAGGGVTVGASIGG